MSADQQALLMIGDGDLPPVTPATCVLDPYYDFEPPYGSSQDSYYDHVILQIVESGQSEGSTNFTDQSRFARTPAEIVDTEITYSSSVHSGGSINSKTTDAALVYGPDINFGRNDIFTLEFWIYIPAGSWAGTRYLMSFDGTSHFTLTTNGTVASLTAVNMGAANVTLGPAYIYHEQWTSIAFCQSATETLLYTDGFRYTYYGGSNNQINTNKKFGINCIPDLGYLASFVGLIDKVRITKGVVRYYSPGYTPYAYPYGYTQAPEPANNLSLHARNQIEYRAHGAGYASSPALTSFDGYEIRGVPLDKNDTTVYRWDFFGNFLGTATRSSTIETNYPDVNAGSSYPVGVLGGLPLRRQNVAAMDSVAIGLVTLLPLGGRSDGDSFVVDVASVLPTGRFVCTAIPCSDDRYAMVITAPTNAGTSYEHAATWHIVKYENSTLTVHSTGPVRAGVDFYTFGQGNRATYHFAAAILENDLKHVWRVYTAGVRDVTLFAIENGELREKRQIAYSAPGAAFEKVSIIAKDGKCAVVSDTGICRFTRLHDPIRTVATFQMDDTLVRPFGESKSFLLYGNATLSTTQKKYGSKSLYIPNDSVSYASLTTPAQYQHQDFNFEDREFTIEMWAYLPGYNAAACRLFYATVPGGSIAISVGSDGTLSYWTPAYVAEAADFPKFPLNTWVHVVFQRTYDSVEVYFDGVLRFSIASAYSNSYSMLAQFYVGGDPNNGNLNWKGYIDDFRVTRGIARYPGAYSTGDSDFNRVVMLAHLDNNDIDSVEVQNIRDLSRFSAGLMGGDGLSQYGTGLTFKNVSQSSVELFGHNTMSFWEGRFLPTLSNSNFFKFYANSSTNGYKFRLADVDWTIEAHYRLNSADGSAAGGWLINYDGYGASFAVQPSNQYEYPRGSYSVWIDPDGKPYFYQGPATNDAHQILAGTAQSLDTWHHLAIVKSRTYTGNPLLTMYVDGQEIVQAPETVKQGTYSNIFFQIGSLWNQSSPSSTYPYRGYAANVRVTKAIARYYQEPEDILPTAEYPENSSQDPYWSNVDLLIHGDTFTDSSSYNRTITKSYGPAAISTSIYKYGTGSVYNAGGPSAYFWNTFNVEVAANTKMTWECWYYRTGTGNYNGFLSDSAGNQFIFIRCPNNSGTYELGVYKPFNYFVYSKSSTPLNQWVHLAVTYDGTRVRLFFNGVLETIANVDFNLQAAQELNYGRADNAGFSGSLGHIADYRLTRGVCRYLHTFTPPNAQYLRSQFTLPQLTLCYSSTDDGGGDYETSGTEYPSGNQMEARAGTVGLIDGWKRPDGIQLTASAGTLTVFRPDRDVALVGSIVAAQSGTLRPAGRTAALTGSQITANRGQLAIAPYPAPTSFSVDFGVIVGSLPMNVYLSFGNDGTWNLEFASVIYGSGTWLNNNAYYTATQASSQYQVTGITVFGGFGPSQYADNFAQFLMPVGGWCDFQIIIGPKPTHPNYGNPSYTALCRFTGQIVGLI